MSSSVVLPTMLPTMPPLVRVRSKGEREVFVWLEVGHNIQASLLEYSDLEPPCTKIHPCYLNLGLKFPLFALFKEIMTEAALLSQVEKVYMLEVAYKNKHGCKIQAGRLLWERNAELEKVLAVEQDNLMDKLCSEEN
ncbi:hypothetical protein D8674_029077 [Pyrus ussuriensis x Pyrus communis]|uniref:Uncharacterized protein n=1 Tax=Pyrus ussuriensis x Pyrus communis TaxID=2448454 RepID=A0A5N5I5C2_9ROSA|nr:hypothetical protein D8674_029077 [Pyrus ussuriensis x Pyrus communis]